MLDLIFRHPATAVPPGTAQAGAPRPGYGASVRYANQWGELTLVAWVLLVGAAVARAGGPPPAVGAPTVSAPSAPPDDFVGPPANAGEVWTTPPVERAGPKPPGGERLAAAGRSWNPALGDMSTTVDLSGTWLASEPVRGQDTRLGEERQELVFGAPLWQNACNQLSLTGHFVWELFQTSAFLPEPERPFPRNLWDVGLGIAYEHRYANDWAIGGGFEAGSASDRLFHGFNELDTNVDVFLRIPQGQTTGWRLSASYSPTAQLPYPTPGAAFCWEPSEAFLIELGVPFRLKCRPLDDLVFVLSYSLLTNVHAEASYRLLERLHVHAGYDWASEGYRLVDRPNPRDEFYTSDMRAWAGVEYSLGRHVSFDLFGGYVFERFYFQSSQFFFEGGDRIHIDPGPFASAVLMLEW